MNKFAKLCLMVGMVVVLLGGTACTKVPAGNVGVKVYLLGGDKGVDSEELGVGRYYIGINEELYLFPTFTQNYVWTMDAKEGSPNDESITFQTVEGMTVGADVGISYKINPEKVTTIFQKYRRGIDEITDVFLRNMVRDGFVNVASTKKVENVYGAGKTEMIKEVEEYVKAQVSDIGIEIERIYLVGQLRLPAQVTAALNRKIEATQKAEQRENEVREAEAEAEKKIAEARGIAESILKVATAQAKANKMLAKSITPAFVEYKRIEKWNGVKSQVVLGADSTPLINIASR